MAISRGGGGRVKFTSTPPKYYFQRSKKGQLAFNWAASAGLLEQTDREVYTTMSQLWQADLYDPDFGLLYSHGAWYFGTDVTESSFSHDFGFQIKGVPSKFTTSQQVYDWLNQQAHPQYARAEEFNNYVAQQKQSRAQSRQNITIDNTAVADAISEQTKSFDQYNANILSAFDSVTEI